VRFYYDTCVLYKVRRKHREEIESLEGRGRGGCSDMRYSRAMVECTM
jgi:hypothetical protein